MSDGSLGRRAIVIGGSIAGLMSAKLLSNRYKSVVVIDKDTLDVFPENRKMVPQSHHVHIVLKAGEEGLNQIFPGFSEDMLALGSVRIDMSQEMVSCSALGVAPKWKSDISLLSQSRPLLEHALYRRVRKECPNVEFRNSTSVSGLSYDSGLNRVTGVNLKNRDSKDDQISSDIIVDASGRGALALRWFKDFGLPAPELDEVKVLVGYASCRVRLCEDNTRKWKGVECGGPAPDHHIAGMLMPIENGLHICSVTSRFSDFPPTSENDFVEYLTRFPHPFFSKALEGAEIVSPIQKMRYESSKRRRYEALENLPKGYMPIGDALCSVNPCYGQGMSSAVLQAKVLGSVLAAINSNEALDEIPGRFLNQAEPVCNQIWRNACLKDFRYPKTAGSRAFISEKEIEEQVLLERASILNPKLRLQLMRLSHLLDDPSLLDSDEFRSLIDVPCPV